MLVKTYEEMFGKKLTVADLVEGFYEDTKTGKVTGFNGKLDIRPPYQREFVYEIDKQLFIMSVLLDKNTKAPVKGAFYYLIHLLT